MMPKRIAVVMVIAVVVLALVAVFFVRRTVATGSMSKSAKQPGSKLARISKGIGVRGNPWINMGDGREVITPYSGPAELTQLLELNQARPLSLCSADFDEDGVPDLISGYAGPTGGIITLLRGNADSIYPSAPEGMQRTAEGPFTDAPFLSPAFVFGVPEAADFIGAGDFDGDGHWDVVAASRGGNKLHLMSGNGKCGLLETKQIDLPGGLTAMVTGEINRRDGLDDLVVGVAGEHGSNVLIFEGPEGALRANPETFELQNGVTTLALGQFDEVDEMDLAVASGNELLLLSGRDRRLSLDAARRAEVKPATTGRLEFSSPVRSIAAGDFAGNQTTDLAVLLTDGTIHALSRERTGSSSPSGKSLGGLQDYVIRSIPRAWTGQLVSARISSAPEDTLLVVDSKSRQVDAVAWKMQDRASASEAESRVAGSNSLEEVEGALAALLPMRLNEDALSDLVLLSSGQGSVSVSATRPQAAFVVINTNDSGGGSLRQVITDANNSAGADSISFNIPGAGVKTINLQSPLPVVTGAVTIDGRTQPGFLGTPVIALRRGAAGSTLRITAGNSVVRGLDICSVTNGVLGNALDVEISTAGGNRIEGNLISEAGVSITSSNNVVGGTAQGAGNGFAANNGAFGLSLSGEAATNNQIQGNSFVTRGTSCAQSFVCGFGISISIRNCSNNVVGGTAPQSRNVISGTASITNVRLSDASGTLVQGNFVGVGANGSTASGCLDGIKVFGGANVTIGGTSPLARNVISGASGNGIYIETDGSIETGNLVQGNYIGTDLNGAVPAGNGSGVVVAFAKGTTIGGAVTQARNIISSNRGSGVIISETGAFLEVPTCVILCCDPGPGAKRSSDFQVLGNYIGTDVTGTNPLANGRDGVRVAIRAFSHEITNNRIAFNAGKGVNVPESSVATTGLPAFRIKILDNAIFNNALLGIDLADDGITQNDFRDVDSGANLRQNFPVLVSSALATRSTIAREFSTAASLSVSGSFNSTPNSTFTLQFFFGSNCDTFGHQFVGAIPIPLGSLPVTTDGNGNASYTFAFNFPSAMNTGFVNSTASDLSGNTSETSACLAVTNPFRISGACKGEGKLLVINGSGFVDGAKVFLNGVKEKTRFVSSTQVIAFKAGKRAVTGDTLKVQNTDGTETLQVSYARNNCSP